MKKNLFVRGMFDRGLLTLLVFISMLFGLNGCAKNPAYKGEQQARDFVKKHTSQATNADAFESDTEKGKNGQPDLPARFQQPTFLLSDSADLGTTDYTIPVGADISSNAAPVTLREIMKKLAVLKGMNVSWASDVDQNALVDVDIRAEDDYFEAIDNILRQLDYFHELKGNSIIVKHKETRKYHVAIPFMSPQYDLSVGGDVLGGNKVGEHDLTGKIKITSKPENSNSFDLWANIQKNLDQILDIWTTEEVVNPSPLAAGQQMLVVGAEKVQPAVVSNRKPGKGYYTVDKPVGLITVTAPRSLQEKIANYIDNLKKELYRQVSIEAKIVEVTLSADNRTGINWEDLLQSTFGLKMDFQKVNPLHYSSGTQNKFLTVDSKSFNLVLDAIEEQGHVEVISNPKISVMNGQPAMITVGQTVAYIESVEAKVEDGVITYSVDTSSVMSGLGMAVIATIIDDNEVILTLTPVTSEVKTPINYEPFGGESRVGLPEVDIREMTTLVKVKNGEMLIVGGLIDSKNDYSESQIPALGDIPGPGGKLFGESGTLKERKELVILLRPVILP